MIKEVQKYIDFLLEELHLTNDVLGILLYGSYILNEEDEYSDLDVLIVVEENIENIEYTEIKIFIMISYKFIFYIYIK